MFLVNKKTTRETRASNRISSSKTYILLFEKSKSSNYTNAQLFFIKMHYFLSECIYRKSIEKNISFVSLPEKLQNNEI